MTHSCCGPSLSLCHVWPSVDRLRPLVYNHPGAQSLLSFFGGVTCVFFLGVAGVLFFGVACVCFVVRKQQSRAKALFGQPWAVGLGLLLALGFLSLGFRFGLTLFRASAWVSSFLGFRLSFKLAFASFRVLGWVYSVFIMGFLSLGVGLALLLLGLRPGFDRF